MNQNQNNQPPLPMLMREMRRNGLRLRISCMKCGHSCVLDHRSQAGLRPDLPVHLAAAFYRCSKCRSKALVSQTHDIRDAPGMISGLSSNNDVSVSNRPDTSSRRRRRSKITRPQNSAARRGMEIMRCEICNYVQQITEHANGEVEVSRSENCRYGQACCRRAMEKAGYPHPWATPRLSTKKLG